MIIPLLVERDSVSDNNEELSVNTKCGHVMELEMMKEWIRNNNTCPICSVESSLNDVIKVYHSSTINERYPEHYRKKYDELQKELKCLQIENQVLEGCSDKIEKFLDKLDYEIERKKNEKLNSLLSRTIENKSDFVSDNIIKEIIQIENETKDEEINVLKVKLFEMEESNKFTELGINSKQKHIELNNKLKQQEDEKNKYLKKLTFLQEHCNKLENENMMLKKEYLEGDEHEELEKVFKNQGEIINSLTKEMNELTNEKKNHDKAISKLNQKADKKYRELESKYQELKMITDLLEYKIQSFNNIEKTLYEFDKNICMLMSIIMPTNSLKKEPFRTFIKVPQKLDCLLWKMVSKLIYSRYGNLIKEIGDSISTVKSIIENEIPIPWAIVEEIEIIEKEVDKICL